MATLSAVLKELVYSIVKNGTSDETNCQYLSVRMKTYLAHLTKQEDLLCHVRVASSCNIPVVQLLREQKLNYLADFLLEVRRDNKDCHCVLVNSNASSSDSTQSTLASRLSLTVRRQGGHDKDHMAYGEIHQRGNHEDTVGRENTQCTFSVKNHGEKKTENEQVTVGGKVLKVECKDLGQSWASGTESDSCVTSLHLRFYTNKITVLREGKLMHDFLHALKLFRPSTELSFALNIEGQKSRAGFRFRECAEIEGQPIITDPQYFTCRSTLESRVYLGTGLAGRRNVSVRCFACHITCCKPATESDTVQGIVSVSIYGPCGMPFMKESPDSSALTAWNCVVDWHRFGLAASVPTSQQPGKEEASFCLTVTDGSLLPEWAVSNHFVLALNFCLSASDMSLTVSAIGQCVREVIQRTGRCFLGDGATAALIQLYQPRTGAAGREQPNKASNLSKKLDILLPMVTESVAEIYTRSHNQHFRQNIKQLTKEDSGKRIESVLRQKLRSLLEPHTSCVSTALSANPQRHGLNIAAQRFPQDTRTSVSAHSLSTTLHRTSSFEFTTCPVVASSNEFDGGNFISADEPTETQTSDEHEFTSQEEESWFSQMENELAL